MGMWPQRTEGGSLEYQSDFVASYCSRPGIPQDSIRFFLFRHLYFTESCTVKKEKKIFLIYKEIQKGSVAKSYMTNDLLRYG
jgi:hypothetical protein